MRSPPSAIAPLIGAALLATAVGAGCSGGGEERTAASLPRTPTAAARHTPGTLEFPAITLGPRGVGIGMHPTGAPIRISASAGAPVRVCPAEVDGSRPSARFSSASFGRRWRDGCRRLTPGELDLPATDGRTHVAIRVLPVGPKAVRLARLTVSWECSDDHFLVRVPRSPGRRSVVLAVLNPCFEP